MEDGEVIIRSQLKELTESLTNLTVRKDVKFETIEKVIKTAKIEKTKTENQDVGLLIECLRVLRNLVAGVPENQKMVTELLNSTYDIWDIIFRCLDEIEDGNAQYLQLLRCTIQLCGNLAVGQTDFQADNLWKINAVAEQIFLRSGDLRSKNYFSMVLLNVIQNDQLFHSQTSRLFGTSSEESAQQLVNFHPVWADLVHSQTDGAGCEFALFCLEAVVCSKYFFEFLDLDARMSLLDIFVNLVEKNDVRISTENLVVLAGDFQKQSDVILTTNQGSVDQLEPENVSNLLLILATASSLEKHRENLQSEKSLLLNALYLLKMVHMAGKEGVPDHAPISKMSELSNMNKIETDIEHNPTYGFKANLIRLIANLCWNHHKNKTLVGELDGVALILDCSQLDGRNPLITQWVVVAVRALLLNHTENQAVLVGLRREGAADHALLRELGIDLDSEGKIKLAPKK